MTTRRKTLPRAVMGRLDALTLGDDFPPKRIRIFAAGENKTTKGTFLFDAEAAASVMREFERNGVDLPMDFDHGSLEAPDGRKRDVPGYYRPEVVDGELWALPQWTDVGLAAIKPGESGTVPEYRYVSPTFTYDSESRRVLSLGPLALTPYPATHNARPLVLSARDRRTPEQIAALGASFGDIAEAIQRALVAVHGYAVEIEDVYADAAVYELRAPDGTEKCMRVTYAMSPDGVVVLGEAVEVVEQYVPVAGGARFVFTPTPAPMVGASQPAAVPQESPPMTATSAVLAALGAQDEAAGVTAVASLNSNLTAARADLAALTAAAGVKTAAEALGVIEAWKRDAADAVALRAKVAADEAARAKAARDAELDACVREGKLSPAERAQDGQPTCWLSSLDAKAIAAFRAQRAPVVQVTATDAERVEPALTPAALSAVDDDTITTLAKSAGVAAADIRARLSA